MRKIIVLSMVSLDGVIQSPGRPGEDPAGGFRHGGWVAPYGDEIYDRVVMSELKQTDYLLGRKTFKIWEAYWPKHAEFWPGIHHGTKYVLSRKMKKSSWQHTKFITGLAAIRKLKQSKGPDVQVWGSSQLVQLLLKHDLVDELRLKIHPLLLGKGKKLFNNGAVPAAFTLQESITTSKGVIIANYVRGGKVKTGRVGAA